MNCAKCGGKGRPVDVCVQGVDNTVQRGLCDSCWGSAVGEYGRWQKEYQRLLARMTRAEANVEMCRRIDAGEPVPALLN